MPRNKKRAFTAGEKLQILEEARQPNTTVADRVPHRAIRRVALRRSPCASTGNAPLL
jgi:hypothetical protein